VIPHGPPPAGASRFPDGPAGEPAHLARAASLGAVALLATLALLTVWMFVA
jgi:hypothetical protein